MVTPNLTSQIISEDNNTQNSNLDRGPLDDKTLIENIGEEEFDNFKYRRLKKAKISDIEYNQEENAYITMTQTDNQNAISNNKEIIATKESAVPQEYGSKKIFFSINLYNRI